MTADSLTGTNITVTAITADSLTGTNITADETIHSATAKTETLIFDDSSDSEKFTISFNSTTNTLDFRVL